MSALRIIPCLDVKAGRVVKGVRFRDLADSGDPAALAARYEEAGADELVLLDVSATLEDRKAALGAVRATRAAVGIPLCVGGGLRSAGDAARLLEAGADKVAVNSAALRNPALIQEIAARFGSQCCVLAVDALRAPRFPETDAARPGKLSPGFGAARDIAGRALERLAAGAAAAEALRASAAWEAVADAGTLATGVPALAWALAGAELGAGEILLTSVDRDGTASGYELELVAAAARILPVPLVTSGGAETAEHFLAGARAGARALLAAGVFHAGRLTIRDLKRSLLAGGLELRPC